MNPRTRDGFTLVELLLVVIVIGVLAALVLVRYQDVKEKAYIDAMMSDLRNYAPVQEEYFHEHGSYATPSELVAYGFAFSEDVVPNDSSEVRDDGFYHRVAHTKTTTECEIDYGLGRDNRVTCQPGDGAGTAQDPPPTAVLDVLPTDLSLYELATLDGTGSTAADGHGIVNYRFTVDGTYLWENDGGQVQETFAQGDHTATLIVWDDQSPARADTATTSFYVGTATNAPPPDAWCSVSNSTRPDSVPQAGDVLYINPQGQAYGGNTIYNDYATLFFDGGNGETLVGPRTGSQITVDSASEGLYRCYAEAEDSDRAWGYGDTYIMVGAASGGPENEDDPYRVGSGTITTGGPDGESLYIDFTCSSHHIPTGEVVSCQNLSSFSPAGSREIVRTTWDWGYGQGQSTGNISSHQYDAPSPADGYGFLVTMFVEDNQGDLWGLRCKPGGDPACIVVEPRRATSATLTPSSITVPFTGGTTEQSITVTATVFDQFGDEMENASVSGSYDANGGGNRVWSVSGTSGDALEVTYYRPDWGVMPGSIYWTIPGWDGGSNPITYVSLCKDTSC